MRAGACRLRALTLPAPLVTAGGERLLVGFVDRDRANCARFGRGPQRFRFFGRGGKSTTGRGRVGLGRPWFARAVAGLVGIVQSVQTAARAGRGLGGGCRGPLARRVWTFGLGVAAGTGFEAGATRLAVHLTGATATGGAQRGGIERRADRVAGDPRGDPSQLAAGNSLQRGPPGRNAAGA